MGGAGMAGAGAGFGENHGFWRPGEAPPVSNNAKIMDFGAPGGPQHGPTWQHGPKYGPKYGGAGWLISILKDAS